MAAALCDAPVRAPVSISVGRYPDQGSSERIAGIGKLSLADLLADEGRRAEVEALDAELHRLALPNDRLRLRFGEALLKLGLRFRDLGFRRLDLYVRERASRPGRWGAESRLMAERLDRFGHLREAFVSGEISWSMAELLARARERDEDCSVEEEAGLLAAARGATVRAMRELLRGREIEQEERLKKSVGCGDPGTDVLASGRSSSGGGEADEEDRIRVRRLLPAHQAMTLEMTLRVIQHMSGGSTGDAFEWLLTEAQTSLLPQVPRELDRIAEDIETRFVERARRRAEALAECDRDEAVAEAGIAQDQGILASTEETVEGTVADDDILFGPLPDDPGALDRVIRELGFQIASAELYRGWTLMQLLALRGWVLLGYVSETQYARERLGMSRSDMYRQARLARHCQKLPAICDAVRTGVLGSSHAGLLVRVATAETEQAWLERAKKRTVKHLKEEVDAVERVGRYVAGTDDAPKPPTEAEMALVHAVDREVLTGRALRRALRISRPDLDGPPKEERSDGGESRVVRASFRAYREAFEEATTYGLTSSVVSTPSTGEDELTDVRIVTRRDETTSAGTSAETPDLADLGIGLDDAGAAPLSRDYANTEYTPPVPTSVNFPNRKDHESTGVAKLDSKEHSEPRPKAAVPWSESLRPDVMMFFLQLEAMHRAAGLGGSFLDFTLKDFLKTWTPHLGKSDVWEHVYRRYRYRCTSPVCDSKNVTLHHIQYRAHGGDDSDENLTTPCDYCHLEGEHGGTLRILPPASRPTYVLGNPQVMTVEGREVVTAV